MKPGVGKSITHMTTELTPCDKSHSVITKADKGGSITILDKREYFDKCLEILNDTETYLPLKSDPLPSLITRTYKLIKDCVPNEFIKRVKIAHPRLSYFYGVPKVHKQNIPLRPIVASTGSPLHGLSSWLAGILSPH